MANFLPEFITKPNNNEISWATKIYSNEKSIGYRSPKTIRRLALNNRVIVCRIRSLPVGIILIEPLSSAWLEIGGLFVIPKFRHLGIGNKLIQKATSEFKISQCAFTFSNSIERMLKTSGFTRSSINSLPIKARLGLLEHRLTLKRILQMRQRTSKKSATFLIKRMYQ
ncbi:MAG: hypothetical protein COU65_04215 [Candidatus Pacebacteria bacterium CG10_big_fil_rev_8_21_14_0_10_42_12]|nr:MAG: hypothetical protein COU65_04215 [Candidatus Pacebacteria bacterium CG10_big_fil_rev_8_21_14_0_10_42_12]